MAQSRHPDRVCECPLSGEERTSAKACHTVILSLQKVRRWRAATAHGNGKCPADLKRDAVAAWRRFVSCVRLLPPEQAAPLWQACEAAVAAVR
jgi:hypothetical protein